MNTINLAATSTPAATIAALPFHLLSPVPPPALVHQTFAAIELGADAVRLKIVRMTVTGGLQNVHDESAACPYVASATEEEIASTQATLFLVTTLRRYAGLCGAHGAMLRAVATSAFARAWDCDDIVSRARAEVGIDLELITGREEAHLLSLAALGGTPDQIRSLLIDVGPDGARVILTSGEQPIALWELAFEMKDAAVALVAAGPATDAGEDLLNALRARARQIVLAARPGSHTGRLDAVVAMAGTAAGVVRIATGGGIRATGTEICHAVDRLRSAAPGDISRRDAGLAPAATPAPTPAPSWGDLTLPGAILLEAILERVCPSAVDAVDKRLADGVLSGLARVCGDADGEARRLA